MEEVKDEKKTEEIKEEEVKPKEEKPKKKENKKGSKKVLFIVLGALLLVVVVVCIILFMPTKEKYYTKGGELFDEGKYDEAREQFKHTEGYKDTSDYINMMCAVENYNEGKYADSKYCFDGIKNLDAFNNYYSLERNLDIILLSEEKNYNEIYTNYASAYGKINDEYVSSLLAEAIYQYANNRLADGYIGSSYFAFKKIEDYKDVKTKLGNKYYKLLGNTYTWDSVSGYTMYMLYFSFYDSEYNADNVYYSVTITSLFSTNPDSTGGSYEFKIKNNTLYIGDFTTYKIKEIADKKIVLQSGKTTYALKKDTK